MALERGTLAKIDRRIFTELHHCEGMQLVKVPLPEAVWSTWRRYCQAIGLTMGAGIAGLIDQELGALVREDEPPGVVFAAELEHRLVVRSEALDIQERRLDEREQSLRASERLLRARTRPLELPSKSSVGRNDRCPCGSGYKYKRCHGN
ncbi:MAG: SEC-C metal-binding domain-containing protein [Acidimicrobiia bacterium]|nr:SEC-C metal-binding domain-containing protein [Acidimicrobiia bacterium]